MNDRIKGKASREWEVTKNECRAFYRAFIDTRHNSRVKSLGTTALMLTWCAIYAANATGVASQPPMFTEFTVIVFTIVARWWGIELVNQSIPDISERAQKPHPDPTFECSECGETFVSTDELADHKSQNH